MISFQQLLALLIISFFVTRLFGQKRRKEINKNEFILWLAFWIFSALAIIFLKKLDIIASSLGFSASGINLLFYAAILILFYMIFKLRLKIAKLDKDLTDLNRSVSLIKKD